MDELPIWKKYVISTVSTSIVYRRNVVTVADSGGNIPLAPSIGSRGNYVTALLPNLS